MLEPDSRYAKLATATHETADGRELVYITRRFLPGAGELDFQARVLVSEGDRIDQISSRTIGDPLQFWRICDANEAMHPEDLVTHPGSVLFVATQT